MEKRLVKEVDIFITVGYGLKEYFEKRFNINNIHVVMNCPESQNNEIEIDFHKLLSIPKKNYIVLYQGVLNEGRGLKTLIQSFQFVKNDITLVILGDGVLKEDLKKLTIKLNIQEKVKFLDAVPAKDIMKYTVAADIGVNLLEPINESKALAAPNKLFQYIHAELPVIASFSYENDNVFSKYKIGKQVNNNETDLSLIINSFVNEKLDFFREECKQAKKEYNWKNQEVIFKKIFYEKSVDTCI